MITAIACLLLLVTDARPIPERLGDVVTRVDMIEFNHCYEPDGCHRFDQIILWEWSPDYVRYHVVGWWVTTDPMAEMLYDGTVTHKGKRYRGDLRRETFAVGWDPEVENRKVFPWECRRGL